MSAKIYSIMSLIPQNGAKYLTANLGHALGKHKNKSKVLLIDFDFNNPVLCYHFIRDSIYDLDNLEPFGVNLKEEDFLNNIINTDLHFDILKGSKLGKPELFPRELTAKIINYAKMNYDYVFIVINPDTNNPSTVISLLNSDEIILVIRNNYTNFVKIEDLVSPINMFTRGKPIKIIENMSNYNNNINVVKKIKDFNIEYLGALDFDASTIDNVDLGGKPLFTRKNVNASKFDKILKLFERR